MNKLMNTSVNTDETKPSTPKTFLRGLLIMDELHKAGRQGLRIPEIAKRTGVQRSTIYRYLDALIQMDFVHVIDDTQTFIFNDARFMPDMLDASYLNALKACLRRISDVTGDSSFLVRRDGGDSLCLHRELGSYPVQVLAVDIGHRQPLGVGSAGLALLSNLRQDNIDDILSLNTPRLAAYGGMTRKHMEHLISSTRERGWAVVGNAAVSGILGVGVPVPHSSGYPAFAVSVSSVLERMPLQRQRFVVDVIRKEIDQATESTWVY